MDVWASIARCYSAFGSPFVPCREDIETFQIAVATHAQMVGVNNLRALLLGVTPGIALMKWPEGSHIVGVEISSAVIDALWPGNTETRKAICASWFGLPIEQKSCHVVIGDGSLIACRFPSEAQRLIHSVRAALADRGLLVLRSYIQPDSKESIDEVFEALFSPDGMTVDCFKLRLYLAIQRSTAEGVAVKEAAKILEQYKLDQHVMRDRLGWSSAAIEPFMGWPKSDAVYSMPTLSELRKILATDFTEMSLTYPSYELGHCCPIMILRVRDNAMS
jgi:hypothetical protein